MEKTCTHCKQLKSLLDFNKQIGTKDGRHPWCKECVNSTRNAKYKADPERRKSAARKYYYSHLELVRMKAREASAKRRAKNPEALREDVRRSYRKHAAERTAKCKEYRTKNPEKVRRFKADWRKTHQHVENLYMRMRNARVRASSGKITVAQWKELCAGYGNKCLACGSTERITIDHVVPVSMGGGSDISNIQPLCVSCNARKNASIVDYRIRGKEVCHQ